MAVPMTADNPARIVRDRTIAQDRVTTGMSYAELAKRHGVSKDTICRVLKQSEIKDIIETGTQQALSLVPKALDVFNRDLSISDDADAPLRNLRNKTADRVMQIAAIAPSNSTNPTVTNIYNIQQNLTLNPTVNKMLLGPGIQDDPDVIDVEATE